MWIALFDFCLFLLLLGFFLYGLREWDHLLVETEDDEAPGVDRPQPSGRWIALWAMIIGVGAISLLSWVIDIFS